MDREYKNELKVLHEMLVQRNYRKIEEPNVNFKNNLIYIANEGDNKDEKYV